jgi:ankyrin repeat protein
MTAQLNQQTQKNFLDYTRSHEKLDPVIIKSFLYDSEIDPNLMEDRGLSPMHHLLNNPSLNVTMLQMLLNRGGDVNLQAKYGETPMDLLENSTNPRKAQLIELAHSFSTEIEQSKMAFRFSII